MAKECEINKKLEALYDSKKWGFLEILEQAKELGLSDKLVLHLPYVTQPFLDSKVKIMLVGQESNGWGFRLSKQSEHGGLFYIYSAMELTKRFQAKTTQTKNVFWKFAEGVYEHCNGHGSMNYYINPKAYFFWSGVRRISYHTTRATLMRELQSPTPMPESLQELIDKHLDSLLLSEIQIAQPDIVLFLSTPSYDSYIKQQLEGVTFQAHIDALPIRAAARLECPSITHTAMLRLYHPNALRYRYGKDTVMAYNVPIMLPILEILSKDKAALLEGFVRELCEKLS